MHDSGEHVTVCACMIRACVRKECLRAPMCTYRMKDFMYTNEIMGLLDDSRRTLADKRLRLE